MEEIDTAQDASWLGTLLGAAAIGLLAACLISSPIGIMLIVLYAGATLVSPREGGWQGGELDSTPSAWSSEADKPEPVAEPSIGPSSARMWTSVILDREDTPGRSR